MNLELLISKYLDGQLSDKEDHLLRSMIKEDDVAKQKFYSAVNIHMAFKEDAGAIEPPKDLVRDTEDKVMMKIMAQATPVVHQIPRWKKASTLAFAASFLLIFTIFDISDIQFGQGNNDFAAEQENYQAQATVPMQALYSLLANTRAPKYDEVESGNQSAGTLQFADANLAEANLESNVNETIETNLESNSISNNTILALNTSDEVIDENPLNLDEELIITTSNLIVSNEEESQEEIISATEEVTNSLEDTQALASDEETDEAEETDDSDKRNIPVVSSPTASNLQSNSIVSSDIETAKNNIPFNSNFSTFPTFNNFGTYSPKNLSVSLTSFFGTDVARFGMGDVDNATVTHFSQSIGYSSDLVNRYGIEVGYSDYIYQSENYGVVPLGMDAPSPMGGGPEKVDPVRPESSNLFAIPKNEGKKVFFGSFFYERSIIKNETYTLDGRVTLGMSKDGAIGITRLFGSYNVFEGIALTFGLEGRLFNMKLSKGTYIEEQYRGSVSMIYGIQFIL
jgi:hypothetical protein